MDGQVYFSIAEWVIFAFISTFNEILFTIPQKSMQLHMLNLDQWWRYYWP